MTTATKPAPAAPAASTPAAGRPSRDRTPEHRLPGWSALVAIGLTGVAGLLLFLLPLRGVSLRAMNGLGLISVLPVASLAGLGLIVVAFAAMLARRRPAPVVMGAMLVALIFCLDGVTAIVEPLPRFATSYQVAGFVNYVAHTGHVAPGLAAYFSWPGFFGLVAFVAGAAGVHSLLPLMTWWPVGIDILLLAPFMLITRNLRITWQARWFAALLFCLGNWVGQDYFSPQSFNYLLYLVFVAILLTWFSGTRTDQGGQRRAAGELSARPVSTTQRAVLLTLVIAIFAVSTISHQLTPFLMLAACGGLAIVRRCTPRGLVVLLGVILIGWVSYATVAYWSGHLGTIFGDVGRLGGTLSSSVGSRIVGTHVHQLAVESRLGLAAVMAGLAVLGLIRRWHRRIADRALLVLLVAPVTIVGLQSYGGEISMRVYMFALPAAAVLAACLFFPGPRGTEVSEVSKVDEVSEAAEVAQRAGRPERTRPSMWSLVLAAIVAISLSGLFVVARYGNEAFEQIQPGELTAMSYIYAHDHGGTSVLWISRPVGINATPQMPWQYRDIGSVQFTSMAAPARAADVAGVAAALRHLGRGAYLITTSTEATFIRQTASYPPSWESRFRAALAAQPGLRVVLANRDAAVYQARLPASAPRATGQAVLQAGSARATAWTPIGLGVLFLAMLLLAAREFIRECVPARRWLLRPLWLVSLPAVALLLVAVVERFRVLS
jgi:hypothetical protein